MNDYKDYESDMKEQEDEELQLAEGQQVNRGCDGCQNALSANKKAKWGIIRPNWELFSSCHMVTVQDVLLICAQDDLTIEIPVCVCDGTASCRGVAMGPLVPISCEAFVTCASEELHSDCAGVDIQVGFQAIVKCDSTFVVCQKEFTSACRYTDFHSFPSGNSFPGTGVGKLAFQEIIRKIDGSALDIEIKSCAIEDSCNPRVVITFKIVDKLWKHENLLVSAIRPYGRIADNERDIVVNREFGAPQSIPECVGCVQPSESIITTV